MFAACPNKLIDDVLFYAISTNLLMSGNTTSQAALLPMIVFVPAKISISVP
jgi:hypothetical protein